MLAVEFGVSMSSSLKVFGVGGVFAGVLLIGGLLGWLATRKTSNEPLSGANSKTSAPAAPSTGVFSLNPRQRPASVSTNKPVLPVATSKTNANLIADWEDKLDEILGSESDESEKARRMLAIFARLPEDGQTEVAQHLSNLLSDQEYAPLGQLLTDPKLPEPVLDILLVDVLNRPNSLKLPLLLEVAREPQHPKAPEAKDLLELYLEEDYGSDWGKWQTKLEQWIKDNPD